MDPRKAVQDGWNAQRDGLPIDANPHLTDPLLYDAWRIGWQDAQHDQDRLDDDRIEPAFSVYRPPLGWGNEA